MKKSGILLLALFFAQPVWAADNAVVVTAGSGITMKSKDVGAGVQAMQPILSDSSGNSIYGTAGTANANVLSVQGIASGTNLPVSQGTAANLNATVVGTGTFAVQASVPTWAGGTLGAMANYGTSPGTVLVPGVNAFVTNSNANGQATAANSSPVVNPVLTNAGAAVVKGGTAVVNGGSTYQAVAASQTATVLQTSTGAIGDYLSHCVIYPTSTSPGVVTVFDNTNAAAGSAILFPGGSTSLSNLAPISVPVGAVSTAGAWKATTGANVSIVCYGKFS